MAKFNIKRAFRPALLAGLVAGLSGCAYGGLGVGAGYYGDGYVNGGYANSYGAAMIAILMRPLTIIIPAIMATVSPISALAADGMIITIILATAIIFLTGLVRGTRCRTTTGATGLIAGRNMARNTPVAGAAMTE
ncbi:hypothetical protein [Parasphingorhabdus halotolerans]|uniref:Lipoprotein n=1 Tax=Parasphingorhabdus halotolerans TaxID=2725558 RepID=A0A6H2DP02_9SPHN|nr:hypothetical protein [Parasphingorhabdus halotolerans]QJB70389.1 hypothetical protein HF685_14870 [Parasphingorhabdus halotolerans]